MPISNGPIINNDDKLLDLKNIGIKENSNHVKDSNNSNGTIKRIPTPDYNNKKVILPSATKLNAKDDQAELESIESYKLRNPSLVQPKPPSTYFVRTTNGVDNKKKRPVSITIGEYPSNGIRKEPSKLGFLNSEKLNGVDTIDDGSITNRLQSELTLTLSRSNLRKKTESVVSIFRLF